eukprot:3740094-Ditylum_brightwellii.AAC.1
MEAYQAFNNFDEFGSIHTDMADKIPKGQELDRLPLAMPVSFENNLSTTKFHSEGDEMYQYSNLMGYWADVVAFNYHAKKSAAEFK